MARIVSEIWNHCFLASVSRGCWMGTTLTQMWHLLSCLCPGWLALKAVMP